MRARWPRRSQTRWTRIRAERRCRRTPTCPAARGPIPTGRRGIADRPIAPRWRDPRPGGRGRLADVPPRGRAVRRRLLLGSPRSLGGPLACGRPPGPTADVLRGLIKLAAAGVKVREGREPGVRTHARRAAECFAAARRQRWCPSAWPGSRPLDRAGPRHRRGPAHRSRTARCRRHPRLRVPVRSRRLRPRSCPSERSPDVDQKTGR